MQENDYEFDIKPHSFITANITVTGSKSNLSVSWIYL